jgi:hypothetical protein
MAYFLMRLNFGRRIVERQAGGNARFRRARQNSRGWTEGGGGGVETLKV